jgi:hypothetical protein
MNVKTLIAASVVALLGATQVAVAQDAPKTRDQVKAELSAARAAGKLDHGAIEAGLPAPIVKSSKTRAEVRAEVLDAIAHGERPNQGIGS